MSKTNSLFRTLEVREINAESRTVELAFSSEIEVERWFGMEVLDHNPGSIRLGRLQDGAPLLVNHEWDEQVGVVESVTIGADRVGRAVVRFGRGELASEIFQDVQDGIRRHVSVGYMIHERKLQETREGGADVYLVTDWEPFEISIVSVPADPTVGVGRELEIGPEDSQKVPAETTPEAAESGETRSEQVTIMSEQNIPVVDVVAERAAAADAAKAQTRAIAELGEKYGQRDLALKAIGEGKTAEEFQRQLVDELHKRTNKPLSEQSEGALIGMSDKDLRQYSMMKVIRALANPQDKAAQKAAAFEFECSQEAQRAYGKEAKGILVPADVLARAFNAGGAANSPTGATSGANVIATDLMAGSFIDMLRNRTSIMRLASTMGGLVGNVDIPKQTAGATAYWVGEGGDATEGTPVIGQIALSPKTVAAYTDITRRLAMQSTPDAEGIVRRDLLNAMAQAIDYAGFYGTGADNQPRGIKNYVGINGKDFSAANPTFAEIVDLETEVAADNADIGQMAYVMNARMRGHLKTTPKFGSGTESTIWEPGNTVNGYRTEVTNQIQNGDVFFGNFADLIIGMWGGLDLTVDPYSLSKSGGLRVVVFQDVDFVLRRTESVAWGSQSFA